jgi:hypothetical protein
MARHLGFRVVRIVNRKGLVWQRGKMKEVVRYEARIFELMNPDGSVAKSIHAVDDGGRWSFGNSGQRLPIEDTFNLRARRKKDRFTADDMRSLCDHLRMPFVDAAGLVNAGEFVFLREVRESADWEQRISSKAVSPEQDDDPAIGYLQRAQTWLEHLDTHASSAIYDLERAVDINPSLEDEIRPLLELARKHLRE